VRIVVIMAARSQVFVITGPSGVGKGTLISALLERMPELRLSVSATTRPPRAGEREGVDYYFLDQQEFDARVRAGDFLEHVDYAGFSYGTLRSELDGSAGSEAPIVLEIEVRGARMIRNELPYATLIFIAPPSLEELRSRLRGRGTDDPEKIARRLQVAAEELQAAPEFAHVVLNDRIERALGELEVIVRAALGCNGSVEVEAEA
jgi:guanylate kinase